MEVYLSEHSSVSAINLLLFINLFIEFITLNETVACVQFRVETTHHNKHKKRCYTARMGGVWTGRYFWEYLIIFIDTQKEILRLQYLFWIELSSWWIVFWYFPRIHANDDALQWLYKCVKIFHDSRFRSGKVEVSYI